MIIDVSFLNDFRPAEKINLYDDMCDFFKSFDKIFYKKKNIYYEEHYTISKQKGGTLKDLIFLPKWFHAKLHILRADELTKSGRFKNYEIANHILGTNYSPKQLRQLRYLPELL